jgi:hypothetical protein
MRCTSTEDLRHFWSSYWQYSRYHIRSTQLHTHSIGRHKRFDFGKCRFQIPLWSSIIMNHIADLSSRTSYYVTKTLFLTLPIYYKLQNAQWSDQYSVHKISPDIHLMCELHLTVKLFTTASSLSDVDSHFFTNQNNSCSCSSLNVCTTAQQYIDTNVRL